MCPYCGACDCSGEERSGKENGKGREREDDGEGVEIRRGRRGEERREELSSAVRLLADS